jgi:hydrogenase nickel incorporation protein HypA/HybF
MHELSLAEAMLDIIKQQAEQEGFSKVTKVVLEIGELSHVEADAMSFCFDAVIAGSLAQGASLEIAGIPAKGSCLKCKKTSLMKNLYDPCEYCGEFGLELVAGDQLRIKHLEVE